MNKSIRITFRDFRLIAEGAPLISMGSYQLWGLLVLSVCNSCFPSPYCPLELSFCLQGERFFPGCAATCVRIVFQRFPQAIELRGLTIILTRHARTICNTKALQLVELSTRARSLTRSRRCAAARRPPPTAALRCRSSPTMLRTQVTEAMNELP